MAVTVSPTVSNILAAMNSFLTSVVPADVDVIAGQPNRVPEPTQPRFIIMQPPRFERLETNVDSYQDSKFTASIAGTTMTVTAFDPTLNGPIVVGSAIYGPTVAAGTQVTALGTGTGGTGTYTVTPSQTAASQTMSAGTKSILMPTRCYMQLDFHAADQTAGDIANSVCATMRDEYATNQFANQSTGGLIVPLLADDARQAPFYNDQQQLEWRWVVEAMLQVNVVVSVPQQFADSAALLVQSVFAEFPT
jgi:hypothetical protein